MEEQPMKEIAKEHQGEDFQNSKQLQKGEQVIDTFLGRNRIATVVRRYPVSVRLRYTDTQGNKVEYTESLRNIRRLV
jgi:hypothetical protein